MFLFLSNNNIFEKVILLATSHSFLHNICHLIEIHVAVEDKDSTSTGHNTDLLNSPAYHSYI